MRAKYSIKKIKDREILMKIFLTIDSFSAHLTGGYPNQRGLIYKTLAMANLSNSFFICYLFSAAQLSKRPGSVWNCLWGNALKRSPGIIRKSRVSYPGPGFLSSATWPSLPKRHYNGLNQLNPSSRYTQGYRIGRSYC